MAASEKRLTKEYTEMKNSNNPRFRLVVSEGGGNLRNWEVQLIPDKAPYNRGAFHVKIAFPNEYPFRPPKITFTTPIYHPNVNEQGEVCFPLIEESNWKPASKMEQVLEALMQLIVEPDLAHPVRNDVAQLCKTNNAAFMKAAEEHTKKHSKPRPNK